MKNKFLLISFLFFNCAASHAQDVFLQTRMNQNNFSTLIDKTRILLANNDISDHLTGTVDVPDDILVSLNDLSQDSSYQTFESMISSVFNLDLQDSSIRIRIPKIGYRIDKLHVNPKSMNVVDPNLTLDITALLQGLTISLNSGIDLDLMIPDPVSKKLQSYLTAHIDPTTITVPSTLDPMTFDIEFEAHRDQVFTYQLKHSDLSQVSGYINNHFKSILIENEANEKFSTKDLKVNPVIVRLNSLSRTMSFDEFKPLLQNHLDSILGNVFSLVGQSLQTNLGSKILTSVFSSTTPSDVLIKNDHLYTRFQTNHFSQPTSDQLFVGVTGDLCTTATFTQFQEQCTLHETFPEPAREISADDQTQAKAEVTASLAHGDSDLVMSLSEEYLNRLLSTTIQAGLWKDSLDKQNLALGPKGGFLVLNERTTTPTLFLDLFYYGNEKGGLEGIFLNDRHPIHFPLRMSVAVDFVNVSGIPHMVIKTEHLLSTVDEIINGIPEYGLQSRLLIVLKKTIAEKILTLSSQMEGQTIEDIDLPILKNLDLEKSWHEASPFGRVNLFFKL